MRKKVVFESVVGFMVAVVFTACSEASIEGKWVEPVPGMKNQVQGLCLEKDGKASSINMATLQYEKWEKKDDMLILSGKSIGISEEISFSDTLIIEKITKDELTLKKGSVTLDYQRQ